MFTVLFGTFAAALVGSPHCAGMCGPFVAFYAGKQPPSVRTHMAYHAARMGVYGFLGATAGLLGSKLNVLSTRYGIPHVAAWLACVAMVLWSAGVLWGARMPRWFQKHTPVHRFLVRVCGAGMRATAQQPPHVKAAVLGALTGFLPCGFLYGFVTMAAGTGSWWYGTCTMLAFWAGTVPVLAFLGAATQGVLKPWTARLQKSIACVLLVVGLWGVFMRFPHTSVPSDASSNGVPACHHH
jgi:sulfite exporter TauE/SafE